MAVGEPDRIIPQGRANSALASVEAGVSQGRDRYHGARGKCPVRNASVPPHRPRPCRAYDTELLGRCAIYTVIRNQTEVVMNSQSIASSVLASVMTIMLALPAAVRADGGPSGYGRYEGGAPHHAPYSPRYYPGSYPHYYPHYYPRYYPRNYPNYYTGYACKNCDNKHHHDNHDHDYDVWYGLLGGGVLGYALGNIYPVPQH